MLARENLIILLICLISANYLSGQTIITDVNRLDAAKKILVNKSAISTDTTIINAAADILTILNMYVEPIHQNEDNFMDFEVLKNTYFVNPILDKLIRHDSLSLPQTTWKSANLLARKKLAERRKIDKSKPLQLLYAQKAMSPSEYLSIRKTLENYQIAPTVIAPAKRIQNLTVNKKVSNGGLLTSDLNYVQALFDVILKRAGKEVVIGYLENLVGEEVPNLGELFPQVAEAFEGEEINYSNAFLERLRQTFFEDLKTLSLRIPELMLSKDYFSSLQSDPVAYNFLALYSIINLSQNKVPIEDALPITNRFLYEGYLESEKEINLFLAKEADTSATYKNLIFTTTKFKNTLKRIVNKIDDIGNAANTKIEVARLQGADIADAPLRDEYVLDYDNLSNLLRADSNNFDLFFLPNLLNGEFDPSIQTYNTIEFYDNFFGDKFKPYQKRAAGLAIARQLNGSWYQDQNIQDYLNNWANHLIAYDKAVNEWVLTKQSADSLSTKTKALDVRRADYYKTIKEEQLYWKDAINVEEGFAFDVLINTIQNFDIINYHSKESDIKKLALKEQKIKAVEERVLALSKKLVKKYKKFGLTPFQGFVRNQTVASPYGPLKERIVVLGNTLSRMAELLKTLDETFAPNLLKKKENAAPILQTTEVFTKILYHLQGSQSKWIQRGDLTQLFQNQEKEDLFNGLLQQSLGSVHDIGTFSDEILGQLIQQTLVDLDNLQNAPDSLNGRPDSLKFYRNASFAVNTINRIMELPMLRKKGFYGELEPLKTRYKSLSGVPQVSRKLLDFIYYLNIQDHSKAISSLIRVFSDLDEKSDNLLTIDKLAIKADTSTHKRTDALTFLRRHGDFIANLIDAKSSNQIEAALNGINGGITSPRVKRRRSLAVSINAYVGLTAGWESWSGDQLAESEDFISFAPSVPIGLAIGGKGKKRSISAFISFIDLGSLFAYRADANAVGESQFNFKNIIKPGFQLQYNFLKSPFYLGAGVQYGPQQRQIDNQNVTLNSIRYFLGFGVDVPLIGLYQKFDDKKVKK